MVLEPEVNSDRRNIKFIELVVRKTLQQGRLPHRRRPHQHYLHYIVVFSLHFILIILSTHPNLFNLPARPFPAPKTEKEGVEKIAHGWV